MCWRRPKSSLRDRQAGPWWDTLYSIAYLHADAYFAGFTDEGVVKGNFSTVLKIQKALEQAGWAEFATVFRSTRDAFLEHERARAELKGLMPEDAKEAIGHEIRAKRSKSGAISFDVLAMESGHAPVQ